MFAVHDVAFIFALSYLREIQLSREYRYPLNTNHLEGKPKVIAAGWEVYLNAALAMHLPARMIRRKVFWKNIQFLEVGDFVNHFSKASIPPKISSSIHPVLQVILALNG